MYYEKVTSGWSNIINEFLGCLRYREQVQFIYLGALDQYLFAKSKEKKIIQIASIPKCYQSVAKSYQHFQQNYQDFMKKLLANDQIL